VLAVGRGAAAALAERRLNEELRGLARGLVQFRRRFLLKAAELLLGDRGSLRVLGEFVLVNDHAGTF
jgi:hypothetical protein